jgi:hypothetical protein
MIRTDFSPKTHGFAFANTWKLQEEERQHIHEQFIAYFVGHRFLGLFGVLLAPPIIRLLRRWLIRHLSPVYGLCGGMCFAALDFFVHGYDLAPFRGQNTDDHPTYGTDLRRYIWDRQLDSLVSDGARFLIWLVSLSYVPMVWPFKGRRQMASDSIQAGVDQAKDLPGCGKTGADWIDAGYEERVREPPGAGGWIQRNGQYPRHDFHLRPKLPR